MTKTIGVFCAASQELDPAYYREADEVGRLLGRQGLTVVYGGAGCGLMEAMALGVRQGGGRLVAIVPDRLEQSGRASALPDEKVRCRDLNDRKAIMVERSELLLALPGGVGTLDEIFTVVAAHTIGYHAKRVVLYNASGFWGDLLRLLRGLEERRFLRQSLSEYVTEVRSPEALARLLEG